MTYSYAKVGVWGTCTLFLCIASTPKRTCMQVCELVNISWKKAKVFWNSLVWLDRMSYC